MEENKNKKRPVISFCDDIAGMESVSHPEHYNQFGIECFDVIEAAIGEKGLENFCYGNALKYLFRAEHKGDYVQDLKKALFYVDKIIQINEQKLYSNGGNNELQGL